MRMACGLLSVLLAVPVSAWATTVIKMELPEVVQKSNLIVEGTVTSVEARWDVQRKLAFTYVSVRVTDQLKGPGAETVMIKLLGGTVGPISVTVPGVPQFRPGERAIVFLRQHPDGQTFDVVGLNQGLYEITQDFAISNISGVELFDPKTKEMTRPLFVQRFPVSEFKARIRQLVQEQER